VSNQCDDNIQTLERVEAVQPSLADDADVIETQITEKTQTHKRHEMQTDLSIVSFVNVHFWFFSGFITFHVRHSRGEMYSGHDRMCVCWSVPRHIPTLLHEPEREWQGCPLVVHYWVDMQSAHGFHCYDNIPVCKLIALDTANVYSAECEMSASALLTLWLVYTVNN